MTPYRFGKDPINDKLDVYVADAQKARTLRDEINDHPDQESTFMGTLTDDEKEQLRRDVYGPGPKPVSGAELQDARERAQSRRKVFREGVKQAIDLALAGAQGRGIEPIETFWGCGNAHNEARFGRSADGKGVTLILLSDRPAMGRDDLLQTVSPQVARALTKLDLKVIRDDATGRPRVLPKSEVQPFTTYVE